MSLCDVLLQAPLARPVSYITPPHHPSATHQTSPDQLTAHKYQICGFRLSMWSIKVNNNCTEHTEELNSRWNVAGIKCSLLILSDVNLCDSDKTFSIVGVRRGALLCEMCLQFVNNDKHLLLREKLDPSDSLSQIKRLIWLIQIKQYTNNQHGKLQ